MKRYGYIRVSSKEQNEERQLVALNDFEIAMDKIYIDKQSGKKFNRKAYIKLLKKVKKGDLIVVKSIDRFGRNYIEIVEQWRFLTKEKQIDIVVLDMPLLDTRTTDRDLTGTFIADLVLQILSYVSEVERDNIKQRQAEGIAIAKAKGIRFGRKEKPIPIEFNSIHKLWLNKDISAREAGRRLGVTHATFLKWSKKITT